jgi:uncharacterized membrane protein
MKNIPIKYTLWLGSIFVFVSLIVTFFLNRIYLFALAAFVFGIIVVVGSLSRYSQCGTTEDERMRKIAAFSMMNSWVSGITLMAMLLFLMYFGWSSALSGIQVISLTIMMMLAMYYAWYVYYSMKGDVE